MIAYQEPVKKSLMDSSQAALAKEEAAQVVFDIIFVHRKEKEAAVEGLKKISEDLIIDFEDAINEIVWDSNCLTQEEVDRINQYKRRKIYVHSLLPIFEENFDIYATLPIEDDNMFDMFDAIL